MTGVVIGSATLALVTTSDIKMQGVVFTGNPLSYTNGLVVGSTTSAGGAGPALIFSNATNSQYIGTIIHF